MNESRYWSRRKEWRRRQANRQDRVWGRRRKAWQRLARAGRLHVRMSLAALAIPFPREFTRNPWSILNQPAWSTDARGSK